MLFGSVELQEWSQNEAQWWARRGSPHDWMILDVGCLRMLVSGNATQQTYNILPLNCPLPVFFFTEPEADSQEWQGQGSSTGQKQGQRSDRYIINVLVDVQHSIPLDGYALLPAPFSCFARWRQRLSRKGRKPLFSPNLPIPWIGFRICRKPWVNTFTNQQDDGKRVMFLGAFDRS